MDRRRFDVPDSGISILGCTLWSRISEEARDVVQAKVKDFQKIKDWTVGQQHNASHDPDLAWLQSEIHSIQQLNKPLQKKEKRSILVVMHHAPSLKRTSSPQHAQSPWRSAFGTDILSQLSILAGVKGWVFGHTHYTTDFGERGVRVVSNQRGYDLPWDETADTKNGFDVRKVIHI